MTITLEANQIAGKQGGVGEDKLATSCEVLNALRS